jgi:uncharacterized membrane protein YgcG
MALAIIPQVCVHAEHVAAGETDIDAVSRKILHSSDSPYTTYRGPTRVSARVWQPQDFPVDPSDAKCGSSGSSFHFCDPDEIFDKSFHTQLEQALANHQGDGQRVIRLGTECGTSNAAAQQDSKQFVFQVQYGVALVRKMDLTSPSSALYEFRNNPESAAEIFARKVHDAWGVGLATEHCGGTGILLFLSDIDRSLYISRGAALQFVLTDRRLDRTIEHMKALLRQQRYEEAILGAVRELDLYLAAGEPGWRERVDSFVSKYFGYVLVLAMFGFVSTSIRKERQERREYVKVSSQLNEIDRSRAEALQGRFQALSCPICLEEFTSARDSSTTDCGNEVHTEKDSEKRDKRFGTSSLRGSDGHPLKLLRCGHVFCDSCFSDWVISGHHKKVDKCPICQQNVNEDRAHESSVLIDNNNNNNNINTDQEVMRDEDAASRAYRRYTRERNFRLERLHRRYPRIIRQSQIDLWSRVGYNESLASDPTFVASDPGIRHQNSSSTSNGESRSSRSGGNTFGGGGSGGGRGGRW